jgi:hypothetical protein
MSVQLEPSKIQIEWIVAPDAIDAEWRSVDCCSALHQPCDPLPPALDEDEWWPGRCIP